MSDFAEETRTESQSRKRKPSAKKFLSSLFTFILIVALVVVGYLYFTTQKKLNMLASGQGQEELAKKEISDVTGKLGKLTILPDEEPVVATILDSQLLATQSAFYQNATNGDKLIVYPKAQKAFIYSPTKNIIVNAGPLILDQNQDSRPVRFELRNGTTVTGAAAKLKSQLEADKQLVSAMSDASRTDYTQTLIIPVNTAIKPDQLTQLATNLNAKVAASIPSGEATSEADILIIVGGQAAPAQQTTATASPVVESSPTP